MPLPRRRPELGVGLGPASVPYTRGAEESPLMGMLDPEKQQEAMAMMQGGAEGEPPVTDDPTQEDQGAGLGGLPPAPSADGISSDQLGNEDLEAMATGGGGQDPDVAAVIQALEDPNTPPEQKQQIETMLALAARRRMAGIQA